MVMFTGNWMISDIGHDGGIEQKEGTPVEQELSNTQISIHFGLSIF